jgi:hypothetical protein
MALSSEIKIFTKNTLIVALFFALVLELTWDYIGPMFWVQTNAWFNDTHFQQAEVIYMGNTATALSISLGQQRTWSWAHPIAIWSNTISISEVLKNPEQWQKALIWTHMQSIQTYVNILETNIVKTLEEAADRRLTLDEHIALLKYYGNKTNDTLIILDEQILDLKSIINNSTTETTRSKETLQTSLSSLNYTWVDAAIANYTIAKNSDTRARIYLIYLERFRDSYLKLQEKNKKILTVLTENREPLIQKTVVVVPSSGTDLLKELGIIQSQAEYKAGKALD